MSIEDIIVCEMIKHSTMNLQAPKLIPHVRRHEKVKNKAIWDLEPKGSQGPSIYRIKLSVKSLHTQMRYKNDGMSKQKGGKRSTINCCVPKPPKKQHLIAKGSDASCFRQDKNLYKKIWKIKENQHNQISSTLCSSRTCTAFWGNSLRGSSCCAQ